MWVLINLSYYTLDNSTKLKKGLLFYKKDIRHNILTGKNG